MRWSSPLVAEHRHEALLAEAAHRRLATGSSWSAERPQAPAASRSRRLMLPWRSAVAR